MKNIGRNMAIAGAAITAAFGYAVKGSMDFEAKLKRVEIQSGATASEMAEIKKTALGEEFVKLGKSGGQVADMYNRLASEGYNVIEMKKMLRPITETAIVLGTEEGETTKLMLNLMQQYNLEAGDMAHISDVLAGALANTSFQGGELAEVMKYAGVAAGELGWSLEGTIPIVDAVIKVTGEASMAGTQFRQMIMKLRVPTKTMEEEFARVGITLDEVAKAIKTPIGLVELLSKAHEKGANFAAMFGARAGSAAAVIARQSVPAIEALTEKVNETGFAHEAAGGIMDTTAGKFATLGVAMQNIRTTIGDVLLPVVSQLADWIGKVAIAIKGWMEAHPSLTKAITLLGAALGVLVGVGGFVIMGVMAFAKLKEALVVAKVAFVALKIAMNLLSGPIGWIILAVGALYIAWETNFGGIRDFTIKVVDKVKEALGWLWDKVEWVLKKLGLYKETAEEVTEANAELAIATGETGEKAGEAATGVDNLADSMGGLGEKTDEAKTALDEFGNKIETFDEWVKRLEEEATKANKKMADEAETAYKRYADAMQPIEDRLYELSHTEEEVAARNLLKKKEELEELLKVRKLSTDKEKAELTKIKEWYEKEIGLITAKLEEQKQALMETAGKTEESASIQKSAIEGIKSEYDGLIAKIDAVGKAAEEAAKKLAAEKWLEAHPVTPEMETYIAETYPQATPIEGYAMGTPYVPRTGLAMVHRGEEINPPGQRSYDNRKSTYSPTIHINNPVVRSDNDLVGIKGAVKEALDESAIQFDRRGSWVMPGG